MTLALFLVEAVGPGSGLTLDGDEGRHAATVKRVRPGEQVLVGDGRGLVATCRVSRVGRDSVELEIVERRTEPAPDPALVVVQALPKGERAELAVELLTELGATEIVPWTAERSVVRLDTARGERAVARWRRTAREATKQSRRAWAPVVAELASTSEVLARLRSATVSATLLLDEEADAGIGTVELGERAEILAIVGPEGGISPDERAAFVAAGAIAVRLGDSVLRTSTAGGAAIAALNVRLGRWR